MQDDPDWPEAATILAHDPQVRRGCGRPADLPDLAVHLRDPTSRCARPSPAGPGRRSTRRVGNPTTAVFEDKLARLEGAEAARGFASGMAAISGAVLSQVQSGDRVVCVRHVYPDAYRFFEVLLPRMGVRGRLCRRPRSRRHGARAGRRARALSGEPDQLGVRGPGHRAGSPRWPGAKVSTTIVDNSWASPIFQRPLAHGADLVAALGLEISGRPQRHGGRRGRRLGRADRQHQPDRAALSRRQAGAVRGLAAGARHAHAASCGCGRHERSAIAVATALREHPAVVARAASGARRHGRRPSAHRQLGPVQHRARRRASTCRASAMRCACSSSGVSWGGHESLVMPAAVVHEQAAAGPNSAIDFGVGPRIVRLHVGLEATQDLIDDLTRALAAAQGLRTREARETSMKRLIVGTAHGRGPARRPGAARTPRCSSPR